MSNDIKGWRVIRCEWTEKERKLGTPKWKAVSRVFTVQSAAQTYLRLAEKDAKANEEFAIETVYCK